MPNFSVRLPDDNMLSEFDQLAQREGLSRNALIERLMRQHVAEETAIVLGWVQVARQGESDVNECAECRNSLDWNRGVYAPLMSNGIVGSLHCADCATCE